MQGSCSGGSVLNLQRGLSGSRESQEGVGGLESQPPASRRESGTGNPPQRGRSVKRRAGSY